MKLAKLAVLILLVVHVALHVTAKKMESCKGLVAGRDDARGEAACENRGFNRAQCQSMGCCVWDDGQCFFCGDLKHDPGCGGDGEGYEQNSRGTWVPKKEL
eukprot:gnl/TRDRNA2_/TRDRNA2_168126_c1_seq3.p2 gnl/TRDRNA2_/TRDRNA2_168126_c1~~gnl/TRDRNA2_/TRDRNA2_168126_c1_seq3.p2  ORF type:complete len:101 (+),score=16.52 gnl/TRDRNA2_/TRDRNA2_168126_c1_seq3:219-521(+)